MKKILSLLSIAAMTVGLLGSCSKINERIDSLEKRIDGIESTSIASVQQQIDGIKASITKLEAADVTVNGKIDELKATAEAHQTLIDALKEADKALGQKDTELEARIAALEGQVTTINGQIDALVNADIAINTRIDQLQSYVDTEIGKAKDWAEETFATLDQYQQTADDLAALSVTVTGISTTLIGVQTSITGLDTKIDGIDAALQGKITDAKTELEGKITSLKTELEGKIATAISASETSIKSWINELLGDYYTIAQVDAKIGELNTAIETAKSTAKERIDSVAKELTALKTAVDTAKAAIRVEYKNAIDVAINKLDGEIRGALKDSILAVNGRIAALDTRVTTLEGKVLALEGNVNKLLAMIQSVSITPAYSDGSVEAVNGILTLKCIVSPAEALIGMESLKDSLLIYADSVKVKTKATTPAYMTIEVSEASVLDAEQGAITLKADISEYLPKGEDKALTIAVNIKNGISDFTTEFVPVTVTTKPIEVTFDLNGITGTAPETQKVAKGGKVTKPADPTDMVHTFAGWYKTKDATTGALSDPWDFDNGTVTADMTLYAQWTRTLESIYSNSDIPKVTNNSAPDNAWVNGNGGKVFIAYSTGNTVLYLYKQLETGGAKQLSCAKTENFTKIGDDYVLFYELGGKQYGVYTLHMTDSKFTSLTYDGEGTEYSELSGTYAAPSYTGELVIGDYTITDEVSLDGGTSEQTFTVISKDGTDSNISIKNLAIDDNFEWYATYDKDAHTLTLDGMAYGYETYVSLFLYTLYNISDYFAGYWAGSSGEDPIVFSVDPTTHQISGLQTDYALFASSGTSIMGYFKYFAAGNATIVKGDGSVQPASVNRQSFSAAKMVDMKKSSVGKKVTNVNAMRTKVSVK